MMVTAIMKAFKTTDRLAHVKNAVLPAIIVVISNLITNAEKVKMAT